MTPVVDLRRGIDLLLTRSDVDPKRLAYARHRPSLDSSSPTISCQQRGSTRFLPAYLGRVSAAEARNCEHGKGAKSDGFGMTTFHTGSP